MGQGTGLHWVRPETAPLAAHVRCTLTVDVGIRMRVGLLIDEIFMSKKLRKKWRLYSIPRFWEAGQNAAWGEWLTLIA